MDYLKECMNDVGNPPLDTMHRNFCLVCANRQCDRSGMNQSAFDNRVKNWKSILFDNVPRAAPDDERYSNIRSKGFTPLGTPAPPRTSVFVPGVPVARPPSEPPRGTPAAFIAPEQAEQEEKPEPPSPSPPPDLEATATPATVVTKPAAPASAVGNTPFEQGMVLEGGPPTRDEPARSPDPPPGSTFVLDDD